MKQRVKKQNNRTKAVFGVDDALMIAGIVASLASAGVGVGTSIADAKRQRELADKQQRQATLAQNQENAMNAQINQQQALNYDVNNEIETLKTSSLKTLDNQESQFRCGGKKRMKKAGGTVTSNYNKLGLYI